MLRRLDLRGDLPSSPAVLRAALPRPDLGGPGSEDAVLNAVRAILNDVQARGDEAVRELTSRFDDAEPPTIQVDPVEVAAALDRIDPVVRTALEVAAEAIRRHHVGQVRSEHRTADAGLVVRSVSRPVERAGCYVPGGRAAYPSTVLMTAVPARAAGVDEVVVCVPPDPDGRVAEVTLAAAAVAGVDAVYAVGGA
ncbi:MAG TPA: histidinol dehydrogenase, partial [Acidimicrobiales bacterium]|nr:histidinol dehydrogenase [Acidimicrobiales bacterium]